MTDPICRCGSQRFLSEFGRAKLCLRCGRAYNPNRYGLVDYVMVLVTMFLLSLAVHLIMKKIWE
jgi:hypothetical protein